jgi:hypothetical protein
MLRSAVSRVFARIGIRRTNLPHTQVRTFPATVLLGRGWSSYTITIVEEELRQDRDGPEAFVPVAYLAQHTPSGCTYEWVWLSGIVEESIHGIENATGDVVGRLMKARRGPKANAGRPPDSGLIELEKFPIILRDAIRRVRATRGQITQVAIAVEIALTLEGEHVFSVNTLQEYLASSEISWREARHWK